MVNYQALVGRQWEYGKSDCFSLLQDYYQLLKIDIPDFPRPDSLEYTESIFLKYAKTVGFERVSFADRRQHDVLIMRLGTRNPMHAAIYVGGDKILHQRMNGISAVEPLRQYYWRRTAAVYRHATCPAGR